MVKRAEHRAYLKVFGARLQELRLERGLTQMQLGEACGVDRAVIGFIERGERDFGVTHVWRLARALEVPVADLFAHDEPEQ